MYDGNVETLHKHVSDGGAAHIVNGAEEQVDCVTICVIEQALKHAQDDKLHGGDFANKSTECDDGA